MFGTHVLAARAREHWAEWLPAKTRSLKASGIFSTETKKAAVQAQKEILELMQAGYQEHEAGEVVLPKYILLPPEEGVNGLDDELQAELDEKERWYQDYMRSPPGLEE